MDAEAQMRKWLWAEREILNVAYNADARGPNANDLVFRLLDFADEARSNAIGWASRK